MKKFSIPNESMHQETPNMADRCAVAIILDGELRSDRASCLRALSITREVEKREIAAICIEKRSTGNSYFRKGNFVRLMSSNNTKLGKALFRFLLFGNILHLLIGRKTDFFILRGYLLGIILAFPIKLFGKKTIYDFHRYL